MNRKIILACILLGINLTITAISTLYASNTGPLTAISTDLANHESLNAVTSNTPKCTTTTVHSSEETIIPNVTVSSVRTQASNRNYYNAYQHINFPTSDATMFSGQVTNLIPETPNITQDITPQFEDVQSNTAITVSSAKNTIEKISNNEFSTCLFTTDESEIVHIDIAPKEHVDANIEKNIQNKNVSISSEENTSKFGNFLNNISQHQNTNDKNSVNNFNNINIKLNIRITNPHTESPTTTETTSTVESNTSADLATTTETTSTVESITSADLVTTSETTSTVVPATPTELQEKDAILLPAKTGSIIVPVKVAPATQDCIDTYDIVRDNKLFSTNENILLFGHDSKSFRCLYNLKEGDQIVLWSDYIPKTYTIAQNTCGNLNNYETDILDDNKNSLLYNDMGANCLRLITCEADLFLRYNRRVVIAIADDSV